MPREERLLRGIRFAAVGLFVLLLIHTLVWAGDFLIPATAAVLGYFVLNRPRRWLAKIGIPPMLSALLFTVVLVVITGFALLRLSGPASGFITDLPNIVTQVGTKLSAEGGPLEAVNKAADAADEIINPKEEETVEVEVVSKTGIATIIAGYAPSLFSQLAFALVLLFFLVSSGDLFILKTVQSLGSFGDKRQAWKVVQRIEDRLGHYLGGITLINAGLGICIAGAMAFWEMPNFMMLGVMAFLFNFVPFIGALVGATIAAALAFISFQGIWSAVGVWMTYMVITSIEGQMITPMLISRHMKLNTAVVFLCVAFFAWIWSVMGMVVALPILTVIKIVCDEIEGFRTVGLFLGQETEPLEEKEPRQQA
jgi:predicted PurR-regulated permease PerM